MNSRFILMALLYFLCASSAVYCDFNITVKGGDNAGLIKALNTANANSSDNATIITFVPGDDGELEFNFTMPADGSDSALPPVNKFVIFENNNTDPISIRTSGDMAGEFRMTTVTGEFIIRGNFVVEGFGAKASGDDSGHGGAILVQDRGFFNAVFVLFANNNADGNGGAIAGTGKSKIVLGGCRLEGNICGGNGGAVSLQDESFIQSIRSVFANNTAGGSGSSINVNTTLISTVRSLEAKGNVFISGSDKAVIEDPLGKISSKNNTISSQSAGVDSTDLVVLFGNLFDLGDTPGKTKSSGAQSGKTEALCNDFGTGAFQSLGYNISSDNSCALNHETDLPNTDPMIMIDQDGLPVLQANSPAIDAGASEVMVFDGDTLASLPCDYRDLSGTARPQDGNGDGGFECDLGAMEVPGAGEIVTGHSAAYFNPLRNGEGNFVEILSDSLAVVYTFTFRPDGSGPAWFIGVGAINGNAIVIDDLLRPVGTSFGDGFDKDAVVATPIGGMSMVFADCEAADPGGNIAYSGEVELGYEGLISRATRLTNIIGCGALTPAPKAGLSGSFFDPARNGEGLIVQWLPNGDVLVIMFTYDQDDKQMWLIGTGTPNGNTVTIDAVYPTTSTAWGRGFKAADIILSDWGTLTLTWTACNTLIFDYASLIEGFGAATRDYVRLSTLSGTSCPEF